MGCCGNKAKANLEYEVTFKDGSKQRFATRMEAAIAAQRDDSVDPSGARRAAVSRAVTKAK